MKKPNEQNACDSFITILRSLTGIKYVPSGSPDEVNRRTSDIDYVLISGSDENDKIAVEHTRVESFDGQIRYVNRSYDIVDSINAGCRERIPPDRYYFLAVPPAIVDSLVGKKRVQFVSDLSSWVAETAPKMLVVDTYIQTEYKGHKITLACRGDTAKLNGNVWRIPEEPENPKVPQGKRLGGHLETSSLNWRSTRSGVSRPRSCLMTLLVLHCEAVPGTTLRGSTLSGYENSLNEVDYIVVLFRTKGE